MISQVRLPTVEKFLQAKRQPNCISNGGSAMIRLTLMSATILVLIISFSLPSFAEPPDKAAYEAQKKYREQERENRKYHEEMEREDRKHRQEIEREEHKHRQEIEREEHKHRQEIEREEHKHRQEIRRESPKYPDYGKHRGYRKSPYDKHRHYDHYDYKGRRYDYHGHWRSWEEWDKYARKNPQTYKDGRYYHENAHLMFRFCDPITGSCVFFSIGR